MKNDVALLMLSPDSWWFNCSYYVFAACPNTSFSIPDNIVVGCTPLNMRWTAVTEYEEYVIDYVAVAIPADEFASSRKALENAGFMTHTIVRPERSRICARYLSITMLTPSFFRVVVCQSWP